MIRFTTREVLLMMTIVALGAALVGVAIRLRSASAELQTLRAETGYLPPTPDTQVAAVRIPTDQPLTYRYRVRVPATRAYRISYSTLMPRGSLHADWYAAVRVPAGESIVLVQIAADPRDERWKITTLVRSPEGTRRVATTLPPDHERVFRESHDVVSTGIDHRGVAKPARESLRLVDERWLVGEGGTLLYGDRPPEQDQLGVFAELQVDDRPL